MDNLEMNLTEEQTEKVLQFQDLTGIENVTLCRDVLQRHHWDLEVAVQDQLNIREGRPTMFSSDHAPPNVVSDSVAQHVFHTPPAGYNPGNNWSFIRYIATVFFHFCYDTLTSLLGTTYRLMFGDTGRPAVTDPVGDVMRFVQQFEDTYGPIHPVFYQGSYGQAISDAKQELRFLLIYLHQDNNNNCTNFCRFTLSNETVVQFINSSMLFWSCNTSSGEGYRVVQSLQTHTYPLLAVIMLKDNRMTVVGRSEGFVDAVELVRRLQTIIQANEAALVAARAERVERSFNQTLRRQQDEAYEMSLRADEAKERRRREEKEQREEEERLVREAEEAERQRKEELQRQKIELVALVPREPPAADPQSVCVVFKMPNGTRLERRFLQTHTLEDIFHFVFCHPQSPDEFEITTNFPKRTLDCKGPSKTQTLNEWGLRKGEVLFVYDLES
ncbi:FAS-associated factor 2-like isoform X3 [Macrosteles quadrilineatus]|uniref:FAS-associated factor 2-like isoform X3 n=1 Tax=Macrosteles quadrilineatus TaxID=74068 RepID=UPI0023E2B360|nr:FAS-associated factor 2-like isoform X3 [Macrosteles quadrilineatus]